MENDFMLKEKNNPVSINCLAILYMTNHVKDC